jgi:hypothetical protein
MIGLGFCDSLQKAWHVAEVLVQGRLGYAGCAGQAVGRHTGEAFSKEQLPRCF